MKGVAQPVKLRPDATPFHPHGTSEYASGNQLEKNIVAPFTSKKPAIRFVLRELTPEEIKARRNQSLTTPSRMSRNANPRGASNKSFSARRAGKTPAITCNLGHDPLSNDFITKTPVPRNGSRQVPHGSHDTHFGHDPLFSFK